MKPVSYLRKSEDLLRKFHGFNLCKSALICGQKTDVWNFATEIYR